VPVACRQRERSAVPGQRSADLGHWSDLAEGKGLRGPGADPRRGSSAVPPKFITVLTLLLPTLIVGEAAREYFSIVNLRVMATPSSVLDVYNDFFSTHPITYFCQINSVKLLLACPYGELVEMSRHYAPGNFNASFFASEGIASVGVWLSPPAALVGGGRDCSGKSTIFGTVFQICSYVRGFFRNCR
jgi:hypothetical protein